jgi:uncharacterized membrane protein YGL010W
METVKMLNYSVFMKILEDQMAFYAAYHQDVRNKATHWCWSIGDLIASQGTAGGWAWFGVLFVGGWIVQLLSLRGAFLCARLQTQSACERAGTRASHATKITPPTRAP